MVPKNKPCKRNNRQISDNTKIAAKQGNAEERPDAGCEIKWWKVAAEMSSFFNIPPDISKADKPQGSGDRVPDISSEIAGRNYAVSYRTSDYFPNVLTTPACPQTILQTADTPVPSHAQA